MKRIFKKYLNGKCTTVEYLTLIEFIRNSGNNKELDQAMKENWDTIKAKSEENPNLNLLGRIHHQIALKENQKSKKTIRIYKISLRIAAALILGLFVASAAFYKFEISSPVPDFTSHFSAPPGAKANFELPDGSMVWLNSGSEIDYSSNFKKNRIIQLNGEAYFEVKKHEGTFRVTTEYGNIVVLGTGFDVKAYPNETFVTTLEHGSLEVSTKSGNEKSILKPGDQAFLNEKNQLQVRTVDVSEFVSWKEGKLIFVRKPLDEVVKMLERWYNVNIVLDVNGANNLWFTGTIEMETISEVLEIIGQTLPIEYSFDKKTKIIKIKAKRME